MAMLRGNLASRPFYNERLVTLGILVGAAIVVALTVFNVTEIMAPSKKRAEFKQSQSRDEAEAAAITAGTQAVRKSVDQTRLTMLANQTREANDLIDQRTFSWTVFFGHIEKTLPYNARLISVAPRVERGNFQISMAVNAKQPDDLEDFIDKLLSTGVFYDTAPTTFSANDDGTITGQILTKYYLAPAPPKAGRTAGRGR